MGLKAWLAPELLPANEEVLGEIESMCGDLNAQAEGNDPASTKKMDRWLTIYSTVKQHWGFVVVKRDESTYIAPLGLPNVLLKVYSMQTVNIFELNTRK